MGAMRILITGGTGTISTAVVARAVAAGHEVTLLNRSGRTGGVPGVRVLRADLNDEPAAAEALAGHAFDVVAQFLAYTPDQVARDLRLFAGRCGQYVLISSASTYAKPLPHHVITEDTPQANPFSAYARAKIACEEVLRASDGAVPWTIVRPSHTYYERAIPVGVKGAGGSWAVVRRILDGRPVIVHGDGESLWTFTWAGDFAVGFVGLFGHPDALGRAVHITSDESITWNRALATIGAIAGREPVLVPVASATLARLHPDMEANLLGDKANTVVFDNARIKALVPGFACPTTFADGVGRAWEWLQAHPDAQTPDPDFDAWTDDVVARVGRL